MMNQVDLATVDLNLLAVFEAVYGSRHVGRAAKQLHVSSSAVSHGLGRLRELFQDPLFLRTPKGVVPTARAEQLAAPLRDALDRVRGLLGSVAPFEPQSSKRRFAIGTTDATAAVLLPRLLAQLGTEAPGIDLSVCNALPSGDLSPLESGEVDVMVLALDDLPARFASSVIHEEEFVITGRQGHPFFERPTLRHYCELQHALVSLTGEHSGYVDGVLAARGLRRRVALSAPSFLLVLAALAESDLLAAVPSQLVEAHAARFGLQAVRSPIPLQRWQIRAITSKAALMDAGIVWLLSALKQAGRRDTSTRGASNRLGRSKARREAPRR